MTNEKIQSLLKTESSNNGLNRKSIGIKATHERLKIQFGDTYGLQYKSIEGVGTTVRVLIPNLKIRGFSNE